MIKSVVDAVRFCDVHVENWRVNNSFLSQFNSRYMFNRVAEKIREMYPGVNK